MKALSFYFFLSSSLSNLYCSSTLFPAGFLAKRLASRKIFVYN